MSLDIMREVGQRALEMIEDNLREGVSYDGERFRYSTRPFAMPARKVSGIRQLEKDGRLKRFKTAKGSLWMVVTGGYADWRRINKRSDSGDFLTWSGKFLRNMNVIEATENTARLGFTDSEFIKRAMWFNVTGVGPSRRLWRFMGLSSKQQAELAQYAASIITGKKLAQLLNVAD